ncbi:hypothetical protein BABINDRAFT_148190 [Babjeviella inositovora NRRL Y-12698]|uniref:DNA endonuclease activator Ctp1 C-terminal domain-containing protein n=1 Tax=Babjeviella inositovora NRRL Y-12698 TaxID=984486 RepID=A0A1E3QPX4_9ASCO|nr:uncharacterized protein BABINDRAFT_148190 [Babjeviella inositovora NRRL Y-12698]ODQ79122.1 hypothetical protein BABINDRAFT_148190 [Babjeviella inositovora NRRL Y-12698]
MPNYSMEDDFLKLARPWFAKYEQEISKILDENVRLKAENTEMKETLAMFKEENTRLRKETPGDVFQDPKTPLAAIQSRIYKGEPPLPGVLKQSASLVIIPLPALPSNLREPPPSTSQHMSLARAHRVISPKNETDFTLHSDDALTQISENEESLKEGHVGLFHESALSPKLPFFPSSINLAGHEHHSSEYDIATQYSSDVEASAAETEIHDELQVKHESQSQLLFIKPEPDSQLLFSSKRKLSDSLLIEDSQMGFAPLPLPKKATQRDREAENIRLVETKCTLGDDVDLTTNPVALREWILEDFRVNPDENHNVSHAFQFVLRGNAKKQCAHGTDCTSCEHFYKVAGDGLQMNGPRWDAPEEKGRYGPADIVRNTSRHQDRWRRPVSPPGFNDADFASTQQYAQNNAESLRLLKQRTNERLVQAINKGQYIFRQEVLNRVVDSQNFVCDIVRYRKVV